MQPPSAGLRKPAASSRPCFLGFLVGLLVSMFVFYTWTMHTRASADTLIWHSTNPASCQEQLHHALRSLTDLAPRLREAEEKARMSSLLCTPCEPCYCDGSQFKPSDGLAGGSDAPGSHDVNTELRSPYHPHQPPGRPELPSWPVAGDFVASHPIIPVDSHTVGDHRPQGPLDLPLLAGLSLDPPDMQYQRVNVPVPGTSEQETVSVQTTPHPSHLIDVILEPAATPAVSTPTMSPTMYIDPAVLAAAMHPPAPPTHCVEPFGGVHSVPEWRDGDALRASPLRLEAARITPHRVWDCFLFDGELGLLDVRLSELYDVVDHFVLVEAATTPAGQPKPLYYANHKARFAKYAPKIHHIIRYAIPLVWLVTHIS